MAQDELRWVEIVPMSSPTELQLQQPIDPFQELAFAGVLVALSSRCICL